MFSKTYKYWLFACVVCYLLVSCSDYQKLLKSNDTELKLEKAIEFYEAGNYFKAQTLLTDLRSYYRGTEKAEQINYYNAYCHYGTGELSMAAYFFKEFANTFPNSQYREEAEYMASYCYYLLSPQTSLDQTFTKRAISELELFIERFPYSEKRDTVNLYIDNLQRKLEKKAFDNAYLYYKTGSYRAAVSALKNVIIDYPDTAYKEDILFYIIKANFDFASNSVHAKQAERFREVIDAYYEFVDYYPNSNNIKEAERIYNYSIKFISENNGL